MSQELLAEVVLLTNLLKEREAGRKFYRMFPDPPAALSYDQYPKVLEFFALGNSHRERLLIAGNRTGKTEGGAYEVACHLTGEYPHWWTGRRFTKPIKITAAGDTSKTVRDIIQAKLLGQPGQWGSGIIPKDNIEMDRITRVSGVADAVDTITVRHKDGHRNVIALKSYEQGRKAFQGTEMDVIWLDEEPPKDVYDECLLRTMTTDGIVMLTFTPLSGMTEVVMDFLGNNPEAQDDEVASSKAYVTMSWDDAPHLSEAAKRELMRSLPPHQRDARSKGIPTLGSGAIYPIAEDDILIDDFPIPQHWARVYAMDVGWNFTAAALAMRDPETHITYITNVYKRSKAEPLIHADAITTRVGKKTKGFIDPASRGRSQVDGTQLYATYCMLGLDLDFAQNAVETGLLECYQGLSTGKIKVFRSCKDFITEYRLYRRDEKGRIVKKDDHIMDSFRYVIMSGDRILSRPRRGFELPVDVHGSYGEKSLYNDLQFGNGISNSWLGA